MSNSAPNGCCVSTRKIDAAACTASAPSVPRLKERILKRELEFSGVLEPVMRALLQRPERVAFGSAKSIAAACGVSATTIHRLVQHCGYQTFSDMRRAFRDHVRHVAPDPGPAR